MVSARVLCGIRRPLGVGSPSSSNYRFRGSPIWQVHQRFGLCEAYRCGKWLWKDFLGMASTVKLFSPSTSIAFPCKLLFLSVFPCLGVLSSTFDLAASMEVPALVENLL